MDAAVLKCPGCGAPARTDARACAHCGARLATISCPSCFGLMFESAKYCSHCGKARQRAERGETPLPCPKCDLPLGLVELGHTPVRECVRCFGLWIDGQTFDQICTDREKQSQVLGSASERFVPGERSFDPKIRYVKCPSCLELMHRVNFAKSSGIIVDVCRGHGTWFDENEVQHIVQFIQAGGLDLAREKEKADLELSRRRLESTRADLAAQGRGPIGRSHYPDNYEGALYDVVGSMLSAIFD